MMKRIRRFARFLKRSWHPLKVAMTMALGLTLLAVLEAYAAWGAFENAPKTDMWQTPWGEYPRAALFHSAMSVLCGVLAFVGSAWARAQSDHDLKSVRSRAWVTWVISLCFMLYSVGMLATAKASDTGAKNWETYQGSAAYEADKALAMDPQADSRERREAAQRITPPGAAQPGLGDWLMAIFLHGLVMLSASAYSTPRPLTQAERQRQEDEARKAESQAKAKATREANKAKREAEEREAARAARRESNRRRTIKLPENVERLFG